MKQLVILICSVAALALTSPAYATGTDTWTGGGADNNWTTAGNWTGTNTPPVSGAGVGDNIIFDGSTRTTNNNDYAPNGGWSSVTFAAGADSFTLQGNGIGFDFTQPGNSTLENDSPNVQTLNFSNNAGFDSNSGFYIDGVHSFVNATGGDIVINSNVELTNFGGAPAILLTFNGPGTTTVNGLIYESTFSVSPTTLEVASGTVVLTNNGNTYSGGTMVNGGTLVAGGSTVLGTGDVDVNSGTLRTPEGAPLSYTVGNDLNVNGGTLFVQVGSNTTGVNNDHVDGTGNINLDSVNSHLFVHRINGYDPANGDRIEIAHAIVGFVFGQFGDAPEGSVAPNDFPGLIQPFALYNFGIGDRIDLQFGFAASFASVAKTPNQFAVGTALDNAVAAGCVVSATNLIGNLPINSLRRTYDLIAPEELASMYEASFAQGMVTSVNLQRRMDDIRAGATGFCNEGFAITDNHGYSKDGKSVADKNPIQAAPADNGSRWGAFITGTGELTKVGDEDDNGGHNGYQLNQAGFTMGVDYRVTDHLAVGVSAGYTRTVGNLVDDGRLSTDGGRFGLYSTYYTNGFYVDGAASGGWNQYDTRRTAFLGQENGSTDGAEFNGMIAVGYDWKKAGCWLIGPVASFEYDYVQLNGFTESNTSLLPLHYGDQDENAYRSNVGFRIARQQNMKPGEGLTVVPELRAAWRHDFGPSSYAIDSNFVGCPDTFTVHGPWIGRDSAVVNVGLTAYCTDRVSAYIFYDGQFGRDNYNNNGISGGFRVAF